MRLFIVLLMFFSCFLSSGLALSQTIERSEKSITYVIDTPGKDKNTLYLEIFKSIALIYNDANNVIQMNDKESGTIIVKGLNNIDYLNFWWIGMPKLAKTMMQEKYSFPLNHSIEINIRDNKFRMMINFTSLNQMELAYPENIYNLIDLRTDGFQNFKFLELETRQYLKKKVRLSDKKISLCIDEMYKSVNNLNSEINTFSDSLVNQILRQIESSSVDDW